MCLVQNTVSQNMCRVPNTVFSMFLNLVILSHSSRRIDRPAQHLLRRRLAARRAQPRQPVQPARALPLGPDRRRRRGRVGRLPRRL